MNRDISNKEGHSLDFETMKKNESIFCEYCSLKCIASGCECECHIKNKRIEDMGIFENV